MKKIIVILCLSLASWTVLGQVNYHYAEGNQNRPILNSIVRTDGANWVVSYGEDNTGQGHFLGLDPSSTATYKDAVVPTGWKINDFRILQGRVFFCGKDMNNSTCLFGMFLLSDLFTSSTITYYQQSVYTTYQLTCKTLARMAVALDPNNKTSIMLIGRKDGGVSPTTWGCDVAVYIPDYDNISGHRLFDIHMTPPPIDSAEIIWDVVATDNWFATVGSMRYASGNTLTLRRGPIGANNYVFFLNDYENRYTFTHPYTWIDFTRVTHLTKDDIAVADLYADNNHQYGMTVTNIEVSAPQINNNQRVTNYEKSDPYELTYLPMDSILVLSELLYFSNLTYRPGVLYLYPYSISNYMAFEHYPNNPSNPIIYSVDRLSASSYFGTGTNYWYYMNYPSGLSTPNPCIDISKRSVKQDTYPQSQKTNYSLSTNLLFQSTVTIHTKHVNNTQLGSSCLY